MKCGVALFFFLVSTLIDCGGKDGSKSILFNQRLALTFMFFGDMEDI